MSRKGLGFAVAGLGALIWAFVRSRKTDSSLGGSGSGDPFTGPEADTVRDVPATPENKFVRVAGDLERASGVPTTLLSVTEADIPRLLKSSGAYDLDSLPYVDKVVIAVVEANRERGVSGVRPSWVRAVIAVENASLVWDAERKETLANGGVDYSIGLMQVRLDTAKWNGIPAQSDTAMRNMLRNPLINILIGFRYMQWQLARYATIADQTKHWGRIAWVSAAYNAGSARYNFASHTFSNQSYVSRVVEREAIYRVFYRNHGVA